MTTQTTLVFPSSRTNARAFRGSWTPVAIFALWPPGIFTGNWVGVISVTAAPAFKAAAAKLETMDKDSINKQA